MRGLKDVEYDFLVECTVSCGGGEALPYTTREEGLADVLTQRGLVGDVDCACGHWHYQTTALGRDAVHVCDAVRALEGAGGSA